MTIAVDLDGCLARTVEPYDQLTIGEPVPDAVTLIRIWQAAGHDVLLHTSRAARGWYQGDYTIGQSDRLDAIAAWLRTHGLQLDVWTGEGKPDADLYLDDRSRQVSADDPVSWQRAENAVRLLASAQKGGER